LVWSVQGDGQGLQTEGHPPGSQRGDQDPSD
jgi:hypothetical protein